MEHNFMRRLPNVLTGALLAGIFWSHSTHASFAAAAMHRAFAPPDSTAYWNQRANILLLQAGDNAALVETAKQYYAKAIKLAPDDAGLKLDLAIAHLMVDDTTGADSLFWEAYVQVGDSSAKLYELLGLKDDDPEKNRGATRNVTAEAVKYHISKCDVKSKKNTKPSGKDKPRHVKPAGKPKRGFPSEELKDILYWRRSAE